MATNWRNYRGLPIRRPEQPSEKQHHPMYSWRKNTFTHLGAAIGCDQYLATNVFVSQSAEVDCSGKRTHFHIYFVKFYECDKLVIIPMSICAS
jgi:hypothetical protein